MLQLKPFQEEKPKFNNKGALNALFREFGSKSTIHGVRYLSERKRHLSEKIFWFFAFGLSVWLCSYQIYDIWYHWVENPVTVSFTETPIKISEIPFPAITLCSETKTFENMTRERPTEASWGKEKFKSFFRWQTFGHICRGKVLTESDQLPPPPPRVPRHHRSPGGYRGETIYETIQDMAPNVSFIMHPDCSWQNEIEPCSRSFIPVFTEEGLCFTFNSLAPQEIYTEEMASEMLITRNTPHSTLWSLEGGFKDPEQNESFPRRICDAKPSSALVFILCLNEYICDDRISGFRFFLHMPGEVPAMGRKYFQVSRKEATSVLIKPTFTSTSEGLRSYLPNVRQCFFSTERKLRFYQIYTQNNCESECLSNFTKIECGCVKFSQPRDNRTHVCMRWSEIDCYRQAEERLFAEHVANNTPKEFISFNLRSSHVRIFFNHHEVTTLKRSETYTTANFLAICGGLLGLFLGVSSLSIIEFVYFFTLRLYWTIQNCKKNMVMPFKRNEKHIAYELPNI